MQHHPVDGEQGQFGRRQGGGQAFAGEAQFFINRGDGGLKRGFLGGRVLGWPIRYVTQIGQ